MCNDKVHVETYQFSRKFCGPIGASVGITVLDSYVLSFDVPDSVKTFPKRLQARCVIGCRRGAEKSNAINYSRMLCLGRKARAEHQGSKSQSQKPADRDPHRITRSALASTLGGIVTPICLAVLRLITNSNFVGCSTGKSAGLVPLRILSTKIAARLYGSAGSGP